MDALRITLATLLSNSPLYRTMLGQAIRAWLGLGRRYGVRCFSGEMERMGFRYRAEAEAWGRKFYGANYIVFHYEPIDLRLPGYSSPVRSRYVGA